MGERRLPAIARAGVRSGQPAGVVFVAGFDLVNFGVVANMNRPGGNVTGLTAFTSELAPKRLELVPCAYPSGHIDRSA